MREDMILEASKLQRVVGVLESKQVARTLLEHSDRYVVIPSHKWLVWTLLTSDLDVGADGFAQVPVFWSESVGVDGVGSGEFKMPCRAVLEIQ